jgi:hypothetical protein
MKHRWEVRRQLNPASDGQRRWDRAYQLLLQWTTSTSGEPANKATAGSCSRQEEHHENCSLPAGFDSAPGPGSEL